MLGIPVVGGFVEELGTFAEHHKAVRKARRHPQLPLVVRAQALAHPLAKGGGRLAQIDGHIKHFAFDHAHQFALGLLQLVVQPTQDTIGRARVVVLHELHVQTGGFRKDTLVEALKEESPCIPEYLGLEHQNVCNGGGCSLHQFDSLVKPTRYCP